MSDELATWYRAQLDEDEQFAPGVHLEVCSAVVRTVRDGVVWAVGDCDCGVPARVLREVEAKRQLIDLHSRGHSHRDDGQPVCRACRVSRVYPCQVVRLLALPYAGQPGYREEWRPA